MNYSIAGVDGEISTYRKGADEYFEKVSRKIQSCPIEEYTKSYITRFMRHIQYKGRTVLILSLKSEDRPLQYDKKFYERRATSTVLVFDNVEISSDEMMDFMKRFH